MIYNSMSWIRNHVFQTRVWSSWNLLHCFWPLSSPAPTLPHTSNYRLQETCSSGYDVPIISHHYKSYVQSNRSHCSKWQDVTKPLQCAPVLTTALGANLGSQSGTVIKAMGASWNSYGAWQPLRCWDLHYVLCRGRRDLKTAGCNLGIEIQNSCGTAIFNCASNHGSCQAFQTLSHLDTLGILLQNRKCVTLVLWPGRFQGVIFVRASSKGRHVLRWDSSSIPRHLPEVCSFLTLRNN